MRAVSILGSTGSIGRQALDVIAAHPGRFRVGGLAANQSVEGLAAQANRFRPPVLSVGSTEGALLLREHLTYEPETIGVGAAGLAAVAQAAAADVVLAATDGMVAMDAVLGAAQRGTTIALSNKELAVSAGELLFAQARARGARILPVDSEHSAIFQCLVGERSEDLRSVVLTASGGPFWDSPEEAMRRATPDEALRHPTWSMGPKNTIDSATLMNKALEIIEASRFFNLRPGQIEVVVHRQSLAHAFVVFVDGSVKAQLAFPDMRLPIGYALAFPQRLPAVSDALQARRFIGLAGETAQLSFEPVDQERFPALRLAYRALEAGATYPAVLSAANEEAGRAFLQGKIRLTDICALVERALERHQPLPASLEAIREADRWARRVTRDAIVTVIE